MGHDEYCGMDIADAVALAEEIGVDVSDAVAGIVATIREQASSLPDKLPEGSLDIELDVPPEEVDIGDVGDVSLMSREAFGPAAEAHFELAVGHHVETLAMRIAEKLGVGYRGFEIVGGHDVVIFESSYSGQPCPAVLHAYDDESSWLPEGHEDYEPPNA